METFAQSSEKCAVEGLSEEVVFQGEAYRMGSISIRRGGILGTLLVW